MGMSMSVTAFKPANDKWRKMKAIWDSCEEAGIPIPREVEKYFNDEDPDEAGVKIGDWGRGETELHPPWLTQCDAEMQQGFEIDTSKLPKDVSIVRFVCSW